MRGLIGSLLLLLAVGASAAPTPARTRDLAQVTLITDSVAGAIDYVPDALATLSQGIDLHLQIATCRRVEQDSCPDSQTGIRPPNVVDLAHSLGQSLGDTVIVAVGYNDFEQNYAGNIEDALAALSQAGVKRVLWPTLRAAEHPYLTMNDDIRAAAAEHPALTVVDWNLYSRSHPDWFQPDGIHLLAPGAVAYATLLHNALDDLGLVAHPAQVAPIRIVTSRLPDGRDGRRYGVELAAQGGQPPYRWSRVSALPRGLVLAPSGRVVGTPTAKPGVFTVRIRVSDAGQASVTARMTLRIRR